MEKVQPPVTLWWTFAASFVAIVIDNDYVALLYRVNPMADSAKLSYTAALILQTIGAGYNYGFDIMDVTGLPSGTVYPALRRLEQQKLIKSSWEREQIASAAQRPARKYYELTRQGKDALTNALSRYRLLGQLAMTVPARRH